MPASEAELARLREKLHLQMVANQAAKERFFSWLDQHLESLNIDAELDRLAPYYNHRHDDERSRRLTVLSTFGWNGVRIVGDSSKSEIDKVRYCVQLLVGDVNRAESPPDADAWPILFELIRTIVRAVYPGMAGETEIPIDIPMPVAPNVPRELVAELIYRMNSCSEGYSCDS